MQYLAEEGISLDTAKDVDLTLLCKEEEIELMRKLAEYPEEITMAAKTLEPSRITRYVMEVASCFHTFYNSCRVKGEEENLMMARLMLADCTRIVIRNVLELLSISAPEKM